MCVLCIVYINYDKSLDICLIIIIKKRYGKEIKLNRYLPMFV